MIARACAAMPAETFFNGRVALHAGDCMVALPTIKANSLDACVCDPPYHLTSIVKRFGAEDAAPAKVGKTGAYARASAGFMGKQWDGGDIAFRPELWREVLRVLKPGAYLLACGGTRTYHNMARAIEEAGFEIRDSILELIAADAAARAFMQSLSSEQLAAFARCIEESQFGGLLAWLYGSGFPKSHDVALTYERTLCESVEQEGRSVWVYKSDGEKMARVPPFRHPDAVAWYGWGTALKPACEPIVLARKPLAGGTVAGNVLRFGTGALNIHAGRIGSEERLNPSAHRNEIYGQFEGDEKDGRSAIGRWPANVITDGSAEVVALFPLVGPEAFLSEPTESCARFFYTAKADDDDRLGSKHPTVKPLDLMQYLVRLVTPPGGKVLDPFAGTGTTGEAAWREGFDAVLIEREPEYQDDIRRRMKLAFSGPDERAREAIKQKIKDKPVDAGPLFGGTDEAELTSIDRGGGRRIGPDGLPDKYKLPREAA